MESAPETAWHHLEVPEVLARLETSSAAGLNPAQVKDRLARVGPNALPEPAARSLLKVVLRQFASPLIYLLLAAAVIAFLVGERGDAAVILVVVSCNAVVGAFQERRAERSMRALRKLASVKTGVVRGGAELVIDAAMLVPGDVVVLVAGDAVAADARVIEATGLEAAEAALTGESTSVAKRLASVPEDTSLSDRDNMVYAGTHIAAGRARAVVVSTGGTTEVGKIAALTDSTGETRTPLERRIDGFGRALVYVAMALFVVVLVIGLARGIPMTQLLMVAISQLVSIVPESLPVAMTIALAVGMQRMAARGTIVRRLSAVESLGSTTIICSDKTGTLTRNEMTLTVVQLSDGTRFEVSGAGYVPRGEFSTNGKAVVPAQIPALQAVLEAGALCNDSRLVPPAPPKTEQWTGVGDPTEIALLVAAEKAAIDVGALRRRMARTAEIPFSAETRVMASAHGTTVFLKGAPEAVFALCTSVAPEVQAQVEGMAQQALRVLAVARVDGLSSVLSLDALRGKAVLLGLVGQVDPPRDEVKQAVAECRAAGIRTIMVTGDHKATGLAIARQLDIATADSLALDGKELARLSDDELMAQIDQISVFARVHPVQKHRIVDLLQKRGEVVAMTGDGVNDAPALARADVGVAMGQSGTEVAKEAAKIIITDDNFATIVRAVEEGRVVYRNIKKVILLLLSTGIAELLVLLGAMLFGLPLPFAALQILWNNVITEGTITVNLVIDPKDGHEMQRPPIPKDEPILTRLMLGRLVLMSVTITVLTLGFFALQLAQGESFAYAQTTTFTLLAVCEWFNVVNCRSETESALSWSLFKNRWLVGALLLSAGLQAVVVFVPFFNRLFHTVPISFGEVLLIGAIASVVMWVEELRKWVVRRGLRKASSIGANSARA